MCILPSQVIGVVIETNPGERLKVRATSNGVTCYVTNLSRLEITVGMKVHIEEADIFLDDGQIVYVLPEDLRGVYFDE